MASHNTLGLIGEQRAIQFLKDLGYTVLETNYRYGRLEADILALNDGVFVVIEVKTRSNSLFWTTRGICDSRQTKSSYSYSKSLFRETTFRL